MKLLSRIGREFQQNIYFDVNARNNTGVFAIPKLKPHSSALAGKTPTRTGTHPGSGSISFPSRREANALPVARKCGAETPHRTDYLEELEELEEPPFGEQALATSPRASTPAAAKATPPATRPSLLPAARPSIMLISLAWRANGPL